MKTEHPAGNVQKKFDFSRPHQRPFMANLPATIDTYEEGVARFFRWRTSLDYYHTIDQVVDFVVNAGGAKVVDLLTDTATLALRLAARKAFEGHIYSFDPNVTLLERAKQRAAHLGLQKFIEFRHLREQQLPLTQGFTDLAVSFFDLHRHPAEQYLEEVVRILAPGGYLILSELLIPKSVQRSLPWIFKKMNLRYLQKNPVEAAAIYFDQEDIIELLFRAGFRQVIVQGLNTPDSRYSGVFSLIAATK